MRTINLSTPDDKGRHKFMEASLDDFSFRALTASRLTTGRQ